MDNCIHCGLNPTKSIPRTLKILTFKESGKFYTEESFEFKSDHYFQYSDEYRESESWKHWQKQGYYVLIMGDEHPMGYPLLIK